jgi:hypothetical protein
MSDDRSGTPAPARNAPCPCGSGRRFKQCCGRVDPSTGSVATPRYPGWERCSADERVELWQTMQRALAAQKSGRLDAARQLYEEVVARAPSTFDAVHMLGVVHLQQGDLDAAESLLTRAAEMMPEVPAIQSNLQLVRRQKREHEGLYSLHAIVAADVLRLFGAAGRLTVPAPTDGSFVGNPADGVVRAFHIVVPGDVLNAAANATGVALARQLRAAARATLWSDPRGATPMTRVEGATEIDSSEGRVPATGTLVVFGINARTLAWLPVAAERFESIVLALDVHDAQTCVSLFDRLSPAALERVRIVARCPGVLADLGLPGAVDPMVFDVGQAQLHGSPRRAARFRIGVFVPAIREREDALRWEMVEWLRAQDAFLRVLYAGTLPSRHIENENEHLVSLVTEWNAWWQDLDALFFWGAEGRMRQYDRLVFEAMAAGLAVVADGYGDYASLVAERSDGVLFFDPARAREAIARMLSGRRPGRADASATC